MNTRTALLIRVAAYLATTVPVGAASELWPAPTYLGEMKWDLPATIHNYEHRVFEMLAKTLSIELVAALLVALTLIILCCRETVLEARARERPKQSPKEVRPGSRRQLGVPEASVWCVPTAAHSRWSSLVRALVAPGRHRSPAIFLASTSPAKAES